MTYRAFGSRVLDTRTRVWYYCNNAAAARRMAKELNNER